MWMCLSDFRCEVLAVVTGITLLTGQAVRADVAPDPLWGGKNPTVRGRERTKVAMVDEVVKLRLSQDTCDVEVDFTMKNTSTQPETMQVGFPYSYPGEMQDFKVLIDGKAVEVSTPADERTIDPPGERLRRTRTTYWQLWDMTFPAETPVKIIVSYKSTLLEKPYKREPSYAPGTFFFLFDQPKREDRAELQRKLLARNVRYILRTGRLWSGPIGNCRIEVTWDGLTSDNLCAGSPLFERDKALITRDKIVWNLKDYEPERDVRIAFTPNTTRREVQQLLEGHLKQNPHDPVVVKELRPYLIDEDRRKDSDAMRLALFKHWETRIAIWGPESKTLSVLESSVKVMDLIRETVLNGDDSEAPTNAAEIAPVVERIATRLKDQLKNAPKVAPDTVEIYTEEFDALLRWCRTALGKPN